MHPASYAIDLVKNKQIFSSPVYKLGEAKNSEDLHQNQPGQWLHLAFQIPRVMSWPRDLSRDHVSHYI